MTGRGELPPEVGLRLRWPLALTMIGLFAERVARAFWSFWTVLLFACSALLLGVHEILLLEVAWAFGILVAVAALVGTLAVGPAAAGRTTPSAARASR